MTFRLTGRKSLVAILLVVLLTATFLLLPEPHSPLHRVKQGNIPFFSDDMDRKSLIHAAEKHLHYLSTKVQNEHLDFIDRKIPYSWLLFSMNNFLGKLKTEPDIVELNQFIVENFDIYQAGGRETGGKRKMLITGYYEPLFSGDLGPKSPKSYPLYRVPPSLKKKSLNGEKKIGRIDERGQFVDFWTRREIESENLLTGYELIYLTDRFDAYLLHVQGSGKVQLPDGSTRSVRFAGSNGLEYNSIGKLLVDEKIMKLEEVSIPAIRRYLENHPEETERILHHNPRFIFFSFGDTLGPRGSSGEVLTPGRSIAIDHKALPGGAFGFLTSRKPVLDDKGNITGWTSLTRFVFPQDSGSAIKGAGRVDVFWGNGLYAETAANNLKEEGALFFLVKKGYNEVYEN
jgi:membrane-bound lytic murein transglycosylase A